MFTASSPHHTEPGVAEKLIKGAAKKTLSDEQFGPALKTQLYTDPVTWRWWILDGMKHLIANETHHLDMPVIVLAPNEDPDLTQDVIKELLIPYLNNARLITTDEVGHPSPLEAPKWIAGEIRIVMGEKNQDEGKKLHNPTDTCGQTRMESVIKQELCLIFLKKSL